MATKKCTEQWGSEICFIFKNVLVLIVKNFDCKNLSTGLAIDLLCYNVVSTKIISAGRRVFWSFIKTYHSSYSPAVCAPLMLMCYLWNLIKVIINLGRTGRGSSSSCLHTYSINGCSCTWEFGQWALPIFLRGMEIKKSIEGSTIRDRLIRRNLSETE